MSWQQRLREMVLAGGAGVLSVVGCGGNSPPGPLMCCNANPDPCCPSLHCGGTVTAECTEKMTCESDGGTWDYGTQGCSDLEDSGRGDAASHSDDAASPSDVSHSDDAASPSDDAVSHSDVSLFCCNANPDPCCPSLHCGATVTVQCTEKMACESDGGTWDYPRSCVRDAGAPDAAGVGPADAGADGNGQSD